MHTIDGLFDEVMSAVARNEYGLTHGADIITTLTPICYGLTSVDKKLTR